MDDTYSLTSNSLYVTGCSATAIVVDSLTNIAMDVCSTICSSKNISSENGYCSLYAYNWKKKNLTSLGIQLTRLNQSDLHLINTSSIKVVMYDIFNITAEDNQAIMRGDKTGLTTSLAWYMKDDYRTCKEAKKNNKTYACMSQNSDCYDVVQGTNWASMYDPIGYVCQCIKGYHGNPYQPDGCQDTTYKPVPTKDCAAKCGTVDVPYPFGLNESCYRDESFALQCNKASNPPTLLFQNYYIVSNISLEEGQLQLKDVDTYYYQPSSTPFISSPEHRTINWVITNRHCEDAKKNRTTFACVSPLSTCVDITMSSTSSSYLGYRCQCKKGYQGNPYLSNGCQDIDECTLPQIYTCNGICINTDGNYSCTCPLGTSGDPKHGVCINIPDKKKTLLLGVIAGASTGISLLLLSIMLVILIRKWKKTNQKKVREKHFRQNHGLLLQQLISSSKNVAERTQIFSLAEIEKATNNFDETRILGQGGHGTVYKGILSDQCIVAIKRSKNVKKTEIDQFINEVAILSQINHRHVVKLFGCCLETEVPLLIYEFISNGTLSKHLHNSNGESRLSWDDRLRIATEAAGALSYLHSAASISIFHRDVKSSNILLDDNFSTKVSDFGASRCIPLDQTHLVTAIQGTFGYLDPEYYQTSQLIEKSDVYSFGVILLELLTRKKPIYSSEDEKGLNLAMHFLQARRENQFFDLVEDCVMKEGSEKELVEIIQLIEMCIRLKGVERPTMKEVEYKLQSLQRARAKKNKSYNAKTNEEETDSLPCPSSYVELIDQAYQGTSRIYSMENELMLSQNYPR